MLRWGMFVLVCCQSTWSNNRQYPQGYYPFQESPARIPPIVRKPPYLQTQIKCPGVGGIQEEQTLDNLCGDLNKGYLPVNPIGQNILGVSYPFELIKNETLDFFSKTLPVLKADDTLPKVAKYQDSHILYNPTIFHSQPNTNVKFFDDTLNLQHLAGGAQRQQHRQQHGHQQHRHRFNRAVEDEVELEDQKMVEDHNDESDQNGRKQRLNDEVLSGETTRSLPEDKIHSRVNKKTRSRESRGMCDNSFGVFCMLFNAFKGEPQDSASDRIGDSDVKEDISLMNALDEPMTPCPSAVEYVTPVFAKNYQGVWRYVVQIPYEGYFTQTVEVVKCLSTKCEFLEGSCLASPRWVSLLVAEIYYPDAYFPSGEQPIVGRDPVKGGPPKDYSSSFLHKRSGQSSATDLHNCDGVDELGCFHVRLYYDWFLIPGSCKCWKNDFFAQYTKK